MRLLHVDGNGFTELAQALPEPVKRNKLHARRQAVLHAGWLFPLCDTVFANVASLAQIGKIVPHPFAVNLLRTDFLDSNAPLFLGQTLLVLASNDAGIALIAVLVIDYQSVLHFKPPLLSILDDGRRLIAHGVLVLDLADLADDALVGSTPAEEANLIMRDKLVDI